MQNERDEFKKNFVNRLIRFTVDIINLSRELKRDPSLWAPIDQLIRAAGSIGANVVEAKASSSKRDYLHFFEIALKSANETKYWLMVVDNTTDKKEQLDLLMKEVDEVSKVLAASVLTLKGKKDAF